MKVWTKVPKVGDKIRANDEGRRLSAAYNTTSQLRSDKEYTIAFVSGWDGDNTLVGIKGCTMLFYLDRFIPPQGHNIKLNTRKDYKY